MNAKTKKIGSMKQMMKYFGLTAMAVMGLLACTRAQVEQPVQKTITLTTTINLEGEEDEDSKALTALGVKTFAVGEQVAVIHDCTNPDYTGKVVSEPLEEEDIYPGGKKARITVALPSEYPYEACGRFRIIYPASMAKDNPAVVNGDGNLNLSALDTQDGTLSSLANYLDLGVFDGEFETINNKAVFPSSISLTNRLAICEFNVFVGAENITNTITKLTFTNGTKTYTINRVASADPIYVAVQPVTSGDIEITANDLYIKTISGKTLAAGKMYPIRLRLPATVNLATLGGHYTAKDGDILAGTLGGDYRIIIPDGATVTLQNASINATMTMPTTAYPGIKCQGSATLILVGNNVVNGRNENYPGIYPGPEGSTLTIQGKGSLSASSGAAPGIGSSNGSDSDLKDCGNILIEGGTIEAHGGDKAPGIGSGGRDLSGDPSCGNITITNTVTRVTVYKGANADYYIGPGKYGSCGTVTVGGSAGYITTSPYSYYIYTP